MSRLSHLARPGGPLPARVYWRRRAVLLGAALLLVLGLGRLLTGLTDGRSDSPEAIDPVADSGQGQAATDTPAAEGTGQSATGPAPSGATTPPTSTPTKKPTKTKTPLPEPEGRCEDSDIVAEPTLETAVAGKPAAITLELSTVESAACIWRITPDTLTLTVTSGPDDIWSSRECPRAIGRREVVVRKKTPVEVEVAWSGRRSDEECASTTEWALPGWYHVAAAALGGEPSDTQFELVAPEAPTITQHPQPRPDKGKNKGKNKPARR